MIVEIKQSNTVKWVCLKICRALEQMFLLVVTYLPFLCFISLLWTWNLRNQHLRRDFVCFLFGPPHLQMEQSKREKAGELGIFPSIDIISFNSLKYIVVYILIRYPNQFAWSQPHLPMLSLTPQFIIIHIK